MKTQQQENGQILEFKFKRSYPYELDWYVYLSEEDIEPQDSEFLSTCYLIRLPRNVDPKLKEEILYHELIELYTGNHYFALLLEFLKYKLQFIKFRLKYDKLGTAILLLPTALFTWMIIKEPAFSIILALLAGLIIIDLCNKSKEIKEAKQFAEKVIEEWKNSF